MSGLRSHYRRRNFNKRRRKPGTLDWKSVLSIKKDCGWPYVLTYESEYRKFRLYKQSWRYPNEFY